MRILHATAVGLICNAFSYVSRQYLSNTVCSYLIMCLCEKVNVIACVSVSVARQSLVFVCAASSK